MANDKDIHARAQLLERLSAILVCPVDRTPLENSACPKCGKSVSRSATQLNFGGLSEEAQEEDWLNRIKAQAKRKLGRFYPVAMQILAPVYGKSGIPEFLATFDLDKQLVVDLGAGTRSYDNKVVCVDGYGYETVHLVADLSALPFADASIDGIISEAVLEHVPDPYAHVAEMLRVLKPGGKVLCCFPFMAAFHASPHDYTRLTRPGLERLFSKFEVEDVLIAGGPTSGLLWTFQEWLAMVGSFGSERLYRLLVPVTWVLSPLKYLDVLLIRHPAAHVIASSLTVLAKKPA
jgi:SAM-dependent methyltransferase